ncbi:MAG: HD domain-containing protein [Lachnospiraceae bacterium]|nr:HD domain-containing protein [Lachnospiraceae bacterium]MEE1343025.1 HD domain-containing protein [Lachnospiraceae bacterium]
MERLKKQMEFILELDKLKKIQRQTYLRDESRQENDAEHSWHLALMAILLSEYANEPVDTLKVIEMVLIHDAVEIDAGDTYAYDEKGNESKREREEKAANRIFSILPKEQGERFMKLWLEFEEGTSSEARFANVLDKIQPMMLNDATNGRAWREHQVKETQIRKRHDATPQGSLKLWEYADELIKRNVEKGNIIKE